MNVKVISRNVGFALLVSALFMFFSVLVSISNPTGNDSALAALAISCLITFLVGIFPFIFVRKTEAITLQDGYMIIFLSWILSFIFGMLPYALWGGPFSVINSLFESVSGYTTTGATILSNVESIPRSLLFWRSSTHFIGGLGVVVFLLLIIPSSSPVRLRLTNMELSSLSRDGYQSRAFKTVFIFTYVYIGLTFAAFICYMLCGMSAFDAINHAFSVVATGGFSTKNMSLASFHSVSVNIVSMVFMVLSSMHFGYIYLSVVNHSVKPLKNPVTKLYLMCLLVFSLVLSFYFKMSGIYTGWGDAFMNGSFHVISLASTTGYAIADNANWPFAATVLVLFMMIQCGCSGSTAGGVKCDRTLVLFKAMGRQIRSSVHPSTVREIKFGNRVMRDEMVSQSVMYVTLYFIIILISSAVCILSGVDSENSFVASVASLGNIGPALGRYGTLGNYDSMNVIAKFMLIVDMFLGRVEIYPILAAFSLMFTFKRK
jgi:trk system potassium uptake protein